ncbi:pickpocket protein 28-like [Uranotaenia lowii]|uniref:pickpocket protein 28-like n=1 Tax=Uranotaenia lowii TaxID=190385 RepID=UPI002479E96E|nr:pickpocket protein 28-like [Uranotaenia lowii]
MEDDLEHKLEEQKRSKFSDGGGGTTPEDFAAEGSSDKGVLREFLSLGSFYGLRYVFSAELKLVERLFWLVVVLLSCAFFVIGLLLCYKRYEMYLVQIDPKEQPSPIWSIPFPAVTLCAQLKDQLPEDKKGPCLSQIVALEKFCEQVCWQNQCDSCKTLFTETQTENGICYTFNNLAAQDLFIKEALARSPTYSTASKSAENWSPEDGYVNYGVFLKYYPRPAIDLSERYHLRLKLKHNNSWVDHSCGSTNVVTAFLHNPVDFPYKARKSISIAGGSAIELKVKPSDTTTPFFMNFYCPERLQCYFQEQRQLEFFRVYSQANCELECRTKYFLAKKKCVLAHMPRGPSTKLCNNSYQSEDPLDKEALLLARINRFPMSRYFINTCNCLPACNEIRYNSQATQLPLPDGFRFPNHSELMVRYEEDHFYGSTRTLRYALVDLIANIGGLLALFLGISVLTVVEFLYYCLLKPLLR